MRGKKIFIKRGIALLLSLAMVLTGQIPGSAITADAAEDGLILYYDFNLQNSFSTVITDASGHQNAGQLKSNGSGSVEGTYSIEKANIYGKEVKALKLTGGDSGPYLQMPDGILNESEAVTISTWVKLPTDTAYQRIWDFGTGSNSYMYLLSDGWNPGFTGYAAAITTSGWSNEKGVQKETNIDKNRWVLTTVVMDGSKMSLYENGQQIGETVDTGIKVSDIGNTTANYIGKGQFSDPPTEGWFAEFKVYNKALSKDEIAAMYYVDDAGIVSSDKSELDLGDTSGVTEDIVLPVKGINGSSIEWKSDNSAIVIEDGVAKVTRPAKGSENVTGKLTATIKYGTASDTKEFDVTVLAEYTDKQIAEHDAAAALEALGDLSAVMSDITLPEAEWGSTITWESTNPAIKIEGGVAKVTRPAQGEENASGKLIMTVTCGQEVIRKEIDTTVIASREAISIKEVESINVVTLLGHSPSLPNYVKVTYTDNSIDKLKTIWPEEIDSSKYSQTGTFTVEGSIVGETRNITANVEVVDKEEVTKEVVSDSFDLNDISLDKIGDNGSILTQNMERDIAYLKLLDNKRMLYNFYKTFGETDEISGVSPLGGWDDPSGLLRGHSTGHYMSALALAYASTGDADIKTKLDEMVSEMHRLQQKSKGNAADFKTNGVRVSTWSTNPEEWGEGFLSAYSPDQFALLEQYTPYGSPDSGIWAPYYTLHKLLAGFLDAYTYTGNEEALEVAKGLGKWAYERLKVLPQQQLTAMWDMYIAGEFGGINESMAQLYIYTNDDIYLKAAKLFDNTNFFDKLAVNVDDIRTRHANQHIPQIIGAMKIYEATVKSGNPEVKYYDIAENFWEMVVSRYAYSIGGVGTGEKFTQPYQQANNISGNENCETCAAYNMMKLTKMLNNYNPDNAEYMDYYERTLYNQILASQTPNVTAYTHNGTTYMLPIGPGGMRSFGDDYNSFTCCHGTGMENHVKYQEAAYAKTDDTLYVGLYLPSTLTWDEKGVKVAQETNFPSEDTKLTVSAIEGKEAQTFNMKLRVPYWATNGFNVKLNNQDVKIDAEISTYVELTGIKAGDVIEINMPWTLHLDKTPDKLGNSTVASVMYGPFVMAAQNDSTSWKTLVLSENLSDSIKTDTDAQTGFPVLTANGYNFAPMFAPQYATQAYHAYFKIITGEDDGKPWYEVSISNTTPRFGSFSVSADMVKEGGSLVITAEPNEGYMVKNLTVNGNDVQVGEDNTYTVENVKEDLVIEGSFRLINPPAPDPEHLEYTASVSSDYTAEWEDIYKVQEEGYEPTRPDPGTGQGWGNWPQNEGSEHWIQYNWDVPVSMNRFDIYWYHDYGDTSVPADIKIMYKDESGSWQQANMLSNIEDVVKIGEYNTINFDAITTTAVRLVLTLQSDKPATGILRWKVSYEGSEAEPTKEPTEEPTKAPSPTTAPTKEPEATEEPVVTQAPEVTEEPVVTQEPQSTKEPDKVMPDKNALKEAIAAAKKLNQADYTANAWNELQIALAVAERVANDNEATQGQIDGALKSLLDAHKALVKEETTVSGTVKVSSIGFASAVYRIAAGKKVDLNKEVTISPVDAANKALIWSVSNSEYATVDQNGVVTANKAGIGKEVTVTAASSDGSNIVASVKVKVMKNAVKKVTINGKKKAAKTVKAGKKYKAKTKVKIKGKKKYTNAKLKWKSSNTKWATVNRKGKITVKKAGAGKTVTITAFTTDGSNKKAVIKIKIKK